MIDYLLLGTFTSDLLNETLKSCGARHEPSDLVQKYIIKSLCQNSANRVFSITSPRMDGYPKTNIVRVPNEKYYYDKAECRSVGFCNLGYYSLVSRKKRYVRYCRKWAKNLHSDRLRIIVYSLNTTFLKAAIQIKKIIPESIICVIVPDLPSFMSSYIWPISFFKKRDMVRIEKLRKKVDFYSLYSEMMADELNISKDKYVVTEGFVDKDKINLSFKTNFNHPRICMYAGDLNPIYGIQKLIDAFGIVNDNCELHIYGDKLQIGQYHLAHNVKYLGMLSPTEIFGKMMEYDLLINPRPSNLTLAKYSFPSKTFEYMASGTPCLMCKLPGLPDDYLPYLYLFKEESVEGYKVTIENIVRKDDFELAEKGRQAAMFLYNNKTTDMQLSKIIKMFEKTV